MNRQALHDEIMEILRSMPLEDARGFLQARERLLQALDGAYNRHKAMDELERICASQATVEVVDEGSGCIVRRTLPLDYEENDNGVKLAGEAMDGRESEIVFLSAQAIEKIQDLTGHGLNRARCGDHQ